MNRNDIFKSLVFPAVIFMILLSLVPPARSLEVIEIINGDHYLLDSGEEVALAGVDTGILKRSTERSQALAREAVNYLASLLSTTSLEIEDAGEASKKGALRSVYLYAREKVRKKKTGTLTTLEQDTRIFINSEIIRRGYARLLGSYRGRYRELFEAAEKEARHKKIGCWRT